MDRAELKARARAQLGGGIFQNLWMMGLAVCLLIGLMESAAAGILPGIGALIVVGPLEYGMAFIFLKQARDHQPVQLGDMFRGFQDDFGGTFLIGLMTSLFTFLWSLLFVIPGIIAAYRYSFAMLNLCENPALGVMEALELSKQQTYGYKGQLFMLNLSFFGWLLLAGAAVSGVMYLINGGMAGILQGSYPVSLSELLLSTLLDQLLVSLASLYLTPYIQLSICGFYLRATAKPEEPQLPHSDWSSEG